MLQNYFILFCLIGISIPKNLENSKIVLYLKLHNILNLKGLKMCYNVCSYIYHLKMGIEKTFAEFYLISILS